MYIPFSPPDITELEIHEVTEALRSGWITTGPRTKQLERDVAAYVGTDSCVCLNSQTACAEMALRLLGVGPGDEVIVPAYTYTATASVVAHVGATLVLVDTQPDRLEMDYDRMADAITERTKVALPAALAGVPCDYQRIYPLLPPTPPLVRPGSAVQEALGRIILLADTAHALGARRGGRMAGNLADFSAFSFHAVKNLTTGEGGALTWRTIPGIDNEIVYRQLQLLSLHGQSKDALAKSQPGVWEYDVIGPWYKCNMTDVAASIGLKQLERYEDMLRRRHQLVDLYDAALHPLGVETLEHRTADYISSAHLYLTRIPGINGDQRNEIITRMAQQGVSCNVHYKPLPMLTAYRNMGFRIDDFPNAYAQFINEITLPLHSRLTDEEAHYILKTYCEIMKEYL